MDTNERESRQERWRELERLDEWLRTPMAVLSLVWLILILWELLWGGNQALELFAVAIWIVFILEFALRFALAPEKGPFLARNWLTILALAVPALRVVRGLAFLRAARALRGARLVRIVGTANRSMNALKATLRRRGFGYIVGLTLLVTALGAAGMLSFEPAREVEGGFTSYGDSLWWTAMLLTTIGSAFWPITTEGRILALLLSIYGLGVLGYVTASFASFFIGRDAEDEAGPVAGSKDLTALQQEIAALRRALASPATG